MRHGLNLFLLLSFILLFPLSASADPGDFGFRLRGFGLTKVGMDSPIALWLGGAGVEVDFAGMGAVEAGMDITMDAHHGISAEYLRGGVMIPVNSKSKRELLFGKEEEDAAHWGVRAGFMAGIRTVDYEVYEDAMNIALMLSLSMPLDATYWFTQNVGIEFRFAPTLDIPLDDNLMDDETKEVDVALGAGFTLGLAMDFLPDL